MSQPNDEETRTERARRIGLFRYMLIREAADPSLTRRQRGALVRKLAQQEHIDADGRPVRITRWTLDRWILEWRQGGFDALVPSPRQSQPRTPPEVVEVAMALKKENPDRTAAQVRRILRAQLGWAPDERTLQRMFHRTGLIALKSAKQTDAFGRFEADRPNELWVGDALHGPRIDGRKTYLFAFLDDHSRAVVGHRWGFAEDTVRLAAALRPALAARGVPQYIYVEIASDKGEVGREIKDLAEMNRLFTSWVENVYHRRVHSETKAEPLARWMAGAPFPVPQPADLAEAFRWSEHRRVAKTATVSLHGNRYQVDPQLVGHKVELVFDPFDLTFLRVRLDGKDAGTASPFQIERHSHPKARPEVPAEEEPARVTTGIDYLGLVDTAHSNHLGQKINYAALSDPPVETVDLTDQG